MILELEGVLECIPVVLPELVDDFWVFVEGEFALILAEVEVIEMIEEVDDFLSMFLAEVLDLIGEKLLIEKWELDDKDMSEYFKLP